MKRDPDEKNFNFFYPTTSEYDKSYKHTNDDIGDVIHRFGEGRVPDMNQSENDKNYYFLAKSKEKGSLDDIYFD